MTSITLWVQEDIEWYTPQEFDPPTLQDIERERQLSAVMNLWVEDYNERMQPSREAWANQDHEGWGRYHT
jgi:hypothetical protein